MSRSWTYLKESRVLYSTRRSSGSDMGSTSDGEVAMLSLVECRAGREAGRRLGLSIIVDSNFPAKRPRRRLYGHDLTVSTTNITLEHTKQPFAIDSSNGSSRRRTTRRKRHQSTKRQTTRTRIHTALQPAHSAPRTAHHPRNHHPPLRYNDNTRKLIPSNASRLLRLRSARSVQPQPAAEHPDLFDHPYSGLHAAPGEVACEEDRPRMLRW
jgi:hypothetical protein